MKPTGQDLAAALISVFEGPMKLTAFQDSGGVWTIGKGHTKGVTAGMTCTEEQAIAWFSEDQAGLFEMVLTMNPLAQAGYVSFGYNVGMHALQKVLDGADTIMNPVHQTDRKGTTLAGLTSRRTLENLLILSA